VRGLWDCGPHNVTCAEGRHHAARGVPWHFGHSAIAADLLASGMHVEAVVFLRGSMAVPPEKPPCVPDRGPSAGPFDRGLGLAQLRGLAGGADGVVVVAEHGHGSGITKAPSPWSNRPFRIRGP